MPRPEAGRRHHHRRRPEGAGVHRRQRREEEHLRRPRHPGQLAPRQAGLHQLPHRLQRRHAPGERHPGLAAGRPRSTPAATATARRVNMYQGSFHGNLVFTKDADKAPLCADCHDAHNIVPPGTEAFRAQSMTMCTTLPRRRGDDLPRQLPRQGVRARRRRRPPSAPIATAVTASCRPPIPASTVSEQNVVKTCAKCHPGANENFADFKVHVNPQDPRSSLRGLVLLDRLRPAHRRRVQLRRGAHEPVHLSRLRKKACTRAATSPRAGPQGRQRASSTGASTCSTAGCTSSSSSASPCSCSRACRSSTRTPPGRSGSWTCSGASRRPASTTGSRPSSPSSTGPPRCSS